MLPSEEVFHPSSPMGLANDPMGQVGSDNGQKHQKGPWDRGGPMLPGVRACIRSARPSSMDLAY